MLIKLSEIEITELLVFIRSYQNLMGYTREIQKIHDKLSKLIEEKKNV